MIMKIMKIMKTMKNSIYSIIRGLFIAFYYIARFIIKALLCIGYVIAWALYYASRGV